MNWINIVLNAFGIGADFLNNRAKLKQVKAEQEFKIIEAQTKAEVNRIISNTDADNQIDLITAMDKRYSWKDEIVTYLFLIPIIIATVVPFLIAFKIGDFTILNIEIKASYMTLDDLPTWYKYVLGAIIIDVLGFRSFTRKLVEKWITKK